MLVKEGLYELQFSRDFVEALERAINVDHIGFGKLEIVHQVPLHIPEEGVDQL